jgi:hypothetical protein
MPGWVEVERAVFLGKGGRLWAVWMRQVSGLEMKRQELEGGKLFQNGTAQYFGVNPEWIRIDLTGMEGQTSCCGVNLASLVLACFLGGWVRSVAAVKADLFG